MLDKHFLFNALASLSLSDNSIIVDIGCGSGGSTQIAREKYPHATIYGIDKSAAAIRYASAMLKDDGIIFVNADASNLPFPDNHFDCCIAKMVFDIAPNHSDLLDEMVRILKPHGTLLIYCNTRTTAQGSALLKNSDKLINAYKRYVRITGYRGVDIKYLTDVLIQKHHMTVNTQNIIKDTHNPGRESLCKYYVLADDEIEYCARNNVLSKVGLITFQEVVEYEKSLRNLLTQSNEYISFEQAMIFATKENPK